MKLKHKKILVYGLGESGLGAIELLKKLKALIYVYDDNIEKLNGNLENVFKVYNLTESFLKDIDLIVVNPSVSIYNENLKNASLLNVKMISEIELAYLFSNKNIISITGSNGKSTTSTLIYNIFKEANLKTSLVGNIGKSFCKNVCENKKQTFVVEVSSFQLETINKFNSKISCFLNFTENHLDRHFSLKNYFDTKLKIFKNQSKKNFSILNYDDEIVKNIKLKSKTYFFSKIKKVKGTYVFDNSIYFLHKNKEQKIIDLSDIKLLGTHNLENVLCACLVAKLYKIKNEHIKNAVSKFYGLNHRLEFVEKIDNVDFYNDSKSTTIEATLKALTCFENKNILLIVGGSDKGFTYENLFKRIPLCVKHIFAIGEVKENILLNAKKYNFNNILSFDSFNSAVNSSLVFAKKENLDVVLLSPATASFDCFKNFEERGEVFKNLIKELKSEN